MNQQITNSAAIIPQQVPQSQAQQQKQQIQAKPKETIYIKNLNEKVKPKEMKEALFHFCSSYGQVMDIFIKSNIKMRGQAFVCFKTKQDAENAIQGLQGFFLFGKQLVSLRIFYYLYYCIALTLLIQQKAQYARQSSDIIKQINGTFNASVRMKRHEKRTKEIQRYRLQNIEKQQERKQRLRMKEGMMLNQGIPMYNNAANVPPIHQMDMQQQQQQQSFKDNAAQDIIIPNKKLFIENIEQGMTAQKLKECFGQFNGFLDLSYIKPKKVAFVEFSDEPFATIALEKMNGRVIMEEPIQIKYAKA